MMVVTGVERRQQAAHERYKTKKKQEQKSKRHTRVVWAFKQAPAASPPGLFIEHDETLKKASINYS